MNGHLDDADIGRSNERTALAWQRTGLSVLGGSAVMTRLTWETLGGLALVLLATSALLATWITVESRGRYAHTLGANLRMRERGGRAPFALALATMTLAATQLATLFLRQ